MVKPLWIFCFGLFSWISISQSQIIISCRFQGVFHVEKAARYSLVFEEAKKTCSELDAMIATKEQVETAHAIGFETCRYGWVENGTVVIPRTTGNPICAAGYIGVYVLHSNVTTPYDVYCYNVSETSEKNCEQYDYHNKSLPSYDPTEEGDIHHSPSSEVSPTHPGQDISPSLTEQGGLVEDRTIDPLMSTTEFPEHSGDHLGTKEDEGGIKSPNLGPNEIDHTNEYDGFIEVKTDDEVLASAEDNRPATDPTIQRETGSFNDEIPLVPDERGKIEMTPEPDSTKNYTESSSGGEAEGSSDSSKNKHRRRAAVPEWLIVCVALVCLGLIFSVCIAINARRLCGQKKKLVINGNKASPEDGVIMEQNGDTVKSQEMVQLVSRDQTSDFGDGDGFSQDNMRNAKDVDMKIGV